MTEQSTLTDQGGCEPSLEWGTKKSEKAGFESTKRTEICVCACVCAGNLEVRQVSILSALPHCCFQNAGAHTKSFKWIYVKYNSTCYRLGHGYIRSIVRSRFVMMVLQRKRHGNSAQKYRTSLFEGLVENVQIKK